MKLTKNFSLKEFTHSRFYNTETIQELVISSFHDKPEVFENIKKLAEQLQILRDYIGKPIQINIAYRPVWWEHSKGRSGNSQHCLGKAADIKVMGMTTRELMNAINQLRAESRIHDGGIGLYPTFIHYDIRDTPTYWDKTK